MDFYKRMQIVCRCIPPGTVATYGQIAMLCGKPGNARQVGYGLNRGLAGKDVPAHRVVNARGILSGAAAFELPGLQKMLLEEEGVPVMELSVGYQVDIKTYGWRNTMEEAERFAEEFRRKGV